MTLQERIDFILNKHCPASVKLKHLSHLMLHLGDYSEDADEVTEAYERIVEAIDELTIEIGTHNAIERFTKSHFGKLPVKPNLTVSEVDRTLVFFLTYNILSMQQVQEIRARAAAYLR